MKPAAWLLLALAAPLGAQSAPTCDSADHRAFDFWVGDWDVTSNGKPAGTNLVTLEENRCVLHEHWTGTSGNTGQSFNFFDRQIGKWRQVWIDNGGNPLDLSGNYQDGKMILVGVTNTQTGQAQQKITFTKNPDGTVRQLWESSTDGGKTWSVAFDGLYRKKR